MNELKPGIVDVYRNEFRTHGIDSNEYREYEIWFYELLEQCLCQRHENSDEKIIIIYPCVIGPFRRHGEEELVLHDPHPQAPEGGCALAPQWHALCSPRERRVLSEMVLYVVLR